MFTRVRVHLLAQNIDITKDIWLLSGYRGNAVTHSIGHAQPTWIAPEILKPGKQSERKMCQKEDPVNPPRLESFVLKPIREQDKRFGAERNRLSRLPLT